MTKSAVSADLVIFTEDILNSKLHFFVQCKVFIAQSEVKAKNDKIPKIRETFWPLYLNLSQLFSICN